MKGGRREFGLSELGEGEERRERQVWRLRAGKGRRILGVVGRNGSELG